jgi:tetratricopeptide (TPR) repeat protein
MLARSSRPTLNRTIAAGAFIAIALCTSGAASAQQSVSWTRCNASAAPLDFQISSCTTVIALARYNRGYAYFDKGDYAHAIADYDDAIRLDPRNADAFNMRGLAYQKRGENDRAIADFDEAIRIDPNNSIFFNNRGSAYYEQGDYSRGNADFDEAIRLNPRNADALNNRCWMRAIAGQLQDALADCNESLRLRLRRPEALDSRGFAYLKLGRLDDAIDDYDAGLMQSPRNAQSLYGRGMAKLQKGDRAGGSADVAAARAIKADIAEQFARLGIPAGGNTATASAALTDAPAAPFSSTIATSSATVKELFEKHDLIGTFAADCSMPVNEQNHYIIQRVNSDYVQRDSMTGPSIRSDASLIDSATESGANELALSRTEEQGRINDIIRVEYNEWRLMESTRENGQKLITGGRATQGNRVESPWMRKCG